MRKTIFIVLLMGFVMPFSMQGQSIQEKLIGAWGFDFSSSLKEISSEKQELMSSFSNEIKQSIEKAYKDRVLVLNLDGSFVQELGDGRITKGTWSLSNDNTQIDLISVENILLQVKIVSLSSNLLLLSPIEVEQSTILLNKWKFTKS